MDGMGQMDGDVTSVSLWRRMGERARGRRTDDVLLKRTLTPSSAASLWTTLRTSLLVNSDSGNSGLEAGMQSAPLATEGLCCESVA